MSRLIELLHTKYVVNIILELVALQYLTRPVGHESPVLCLHSKLHLLKPKPAVFLTSACWNWLYVMHVIQLNFAA